MRNVSAELVETSGEEAVLRAFRDNSTPELPLQNIVIPITGIPDIAEAVGFHELWVPLSIEDPLHFSIDRRYDQHNLLGESERPEHREVWEPLTAEHDRWRENLRLSRTDTYRLMGTIAASDLYIDPSSRPKDISVKELKKLNRLFDAFTGDWGALLSVAIEYVSISGASSIKNDQKQTFTCASIMIIESEEEFIENQGKNPVEVFASSI